MSKELDGQEVARAVAKWLQSDDFKKLCDHKTLGISESMRPDLNDRLYFAFLHGAKAGADIMAEALA